MKKVAVLLDRENRNSSYLHNLAYGVKNPLLCLQQTPTQHFIYQTFGLLINDKKLDDFIISRDGIMILIDLSSLLNNLFDNIIKRIQTIIQLIPNKPLLIVLENTSADSFQYNLIKDLLKNKYHKCANQDEYYNSRAWFIDILTSSDKNVIPNITSRNISENILISKFINATLPLEIWDHYGRLRIVYYSLMKYGILGTMDPQGWLCTNWKKYKTSVGHGHLWHYTLTRFWAQILFGIISKNFYKSFDELYNNHPEIHQGKLFQKYYSNDVLFSDQARNQWIPPNLIANF